MLMTAKSIKRTALDILKGNWAAAIVTCLIPFALSFFALGIFELIYGLSGGTAVKVIAVAVYVILMLFLLFPVMLGTLRCFRSLNEGGKIYINEIFIYFTSYKRYRRVLGGIIIMVLRLSLAAFALFLPSAIIEFAASGGFDFLMGGAPPIWFTNLWVIALFLRCLVIAILLFVALNYYLLPYVFVINDNIDILEAIHLSSKASKYSTVSFLGLMISFAGWFLLCLFAIPAVFILPYMVLSYTVHCYEAVKVYNHKITPQSDSSFVEEDFKI